MVTVLDVEIMQAVHDAADHVEPGDETGLGAFVSGRVHGWLAAQDADLLAQFSDMWRISRLLSHAGDEGLTVLDIARVFDVSGVRVLRVLERLAMDGKARYERATRGSRTVVVWYPVGDEGSEGPPSIPLPGARVGDRTVIASCCNAEDDTHALILFLEPEAPYYTVTDYDLADPASGTTDLDRFPNIVPAVEFYHQAGGDY